MPQRPLLTVDNLSVTLDRHPILKDISFSVHKGDVLAIVGPNGAGKSVLLKALLGLIPHQGKVRWHSHPKIGYVPQHFSVDKDLPLSVGEFMSMKEPDRKKAIDILSSVGMHGDHIKEHREGHILSQRLGWLSGGQLQRVMIAWAIADDPDVLLFDEPTSGIDVGGEETIYHLLQKLHEKKKMTSLMISHDLNMVYKYADNVICINKQMTCYGIPAKVLDAEALATLYGGHTSLYKHGHHPDHVKD